MKKILLTLLFAFAYIHMANAQFAGAPQAAGGFEGPGAPSTASITVKQALSMPDDSIVVLTGKIVNALGDEKYLFRDSTGDVIIEIDDDEWYGIKVTPENVIEITGELDKEFLERTKIDVKSFVVKQ